MKKYIVIAEEGERPLIDKVRQELGVAWPEAEVVVTGVGAINIIRSLQGLDREAELLNIGYAGSANFDLGSWIEVTEVRLNHPNVTYAEPILEAYQNPPRTLGGVFVLRRQTPSEVCP